jgi:glucose-6-phosphate isomerase, archaeal
MIDLSRNSGLPLSLGEDGRLIFGEGLTPVAPAVRRKQDMLEVLLEPEARGPEELYLMYRNVMREGDGQSIRDAGLRYDITVIKPGILGREFIKTAGHYHPEKKGTGITYPEVYEVIFGVAHYLLQELVPGEDQVRRVALLEAKAGSRVMMPANFGHITINPGNTYLVMANWVAEEFASEYGQFKEKKGGAYYEVVAGEDSEFLPNRLYQPLPPFSEWRVVEAPELNLTRERPFYRSFLENPGGFRYLKEPEKYREDFARYVERAEQGP